MVNEAGAVSGGGWGPRQGGQRAGGRGMRGCGDGTRERDGDRDWIHVYKMEIRLFPFS